LPESGDGFFTVLIDTVISSKPTTGGSTFEFGDAVGDVLGVTTVVVSGDDDAAGW